MKLYQHNCDFFFFNDTATTEIYTLSLHDALPICWKRNPILELCSPPHAGRVGTHHAHPRRRSEEHTSELQSQSNLVCRLLLEKIKTINVKLSNSKVDDISLALYNTTTDEAQGTAM